MAYYVDFNGSTYELPTYTLTIAEKIDKVEHEAVKTTVLREKLRNLYKLLSDLFGTEQIDAALGGDFENCDPNDINILYLKVIKAYNKPLTDFQGEQMKDQIDSSGVAEVVKLLNAMQKSNINLKPNGVPFKKT